jgi:hypothetical protein
MKDIVFWYATPRNYGCLQMGQRASQWQDAVFSHKGTKDHGVISWLSFAKYAGLRKIYS